MLSIMMLLAISTTAQVVVGSEPTDPASWSALPADKPLVLSWASRDEHYAQSAMPRITIRHENTLTAWRGETVSALAVLMSRHATQPLRLEMRLADTSSHWSDSVASARFVRYVLCDEKRGCGGNAMNTPTYLVPDIIDVDTAWALTPMTTRPVWVSVRVPHDAVAGDHRLYLTVTDARSHTELGRLALTVRVVDRTLPYPSDYKFHVDFWQQPYSVARVDGVSRWSQRHFDLLKPYLAMLAKEARKLLPPFSSMSHGANRAMTSSTP